MHTAPAVSVRCSGGRWWRVLQTALPTLAVLILGIWALQWAQLPVGLVGLPVVVTALLSWHWAASAPLDLVWDGQRWTANGQLGQLDVMLDAGGAMLLRLKADGGRRPLWMAVTPSEAGVAMHGLRVAAYHRVPEQPPERSQNPSPEPPPGSVHR